MKDTNLLKHNVLYQDNKIIQGFQKCHTQKQIHNIHLEHAQNELSDIPEDFIKRELAYKLGLYIIEKDLVSYYKRNCGFIKSLVAEINVASPGIKYANLEENVFIVDQEKFTNSELIEAVKNYYAERFI